MLLSLAECGWQAVLPADDGDGDDEGLVVYLPLGQGWQTVLPAIALNEFAGQLAHALLSAARYFPAGHNAIADEQQHAMSHASSRCNI